MKRIVYILAGFLVLFIVGCSTTEANYRAAYEKAKEKQLDTGDSITTQALKNEATPKNMRFGEITLPVRTEPIGITKDGGGKNEYLCLYNVVAGSFRQKFNAVSMAQRLADDGYDMAFVVHNRMGIYYVVAGSVSTPAAALQLLDSVRADGRMLLKPPFPYVLRAAHLVR